MVQVARGEEARRGREDVDAALTAAGGQREAPLRRLPLILYWQGTSPGFLVEYEDD